MKFSPDVVEEILIICPIAIA